MGYNNPNDPNFNANQQRSRQYTPGVTQTPQAGASNNGGAVPHLANNANVSSGHGAMSAQQVRAMQQFLNNHGFMVAQDGKYGPQTAAAAKAFRMNHKGGAAWSAKNGVGTHPAARTTPPHDPAPGQVPNATTPTPAASGVNPDDAFNTLLQQLLGQGGNVGSMVDPKSFGNAAAAPSTALAASLGRQVKANPLQEAQSQHDISSWYGLDPKDPNYKLSVLARLAQAGVNDQKAANDASGNTADIAKSLVSSVGGSANDGSSTVAAAGADAAGTMSALGAVSKQYANDMNPILAAEARGAMKKEHAANSQTLLQLQDQMAQAQGQATADRATGVSGATDRNNALGQQRFANKGNLLSTLAQMRAVDPMAGNLKNALTAAQIDKTNAQTHQILSGKTGTGKVYKIDLAKSTQGIINHLGYTVNPSGQAVVPTSDHTRLASTIGAFLRSQGLHPGDGQFKKIGDAIFGGFVDQHGRPLVAPPGWQI